MMPRGPFSRVFLLGLDGATFRLLQPWAEQGHLPTMARLMAEGAWGPLVSTMPPATPVAWTSMVTGVYPGKHGVFGFIKWRPGSYDLTVVTSPDRRRPAIWNLLTQAGLRSIVVDVPMTYPPEPIKGIMISGLGTPEVTAEFVHPRPLREVILREFGPYPLDIYPHGPVQTLLDDARRLTEHRLALACFLMREFPWEFFMLGLMTTDRIQHVAWKYVDPYHPLYTEEEARRYGPAVLDYYRMLDGVMAELVAGLDAQTVFLVASDHGFGPLERSVSLQCWLARQGFLAMGGRVWAYEPNGHVPAFAARGPGRVVQHPWEARAGRGGEALTLEVDGPDAFAAAVFRMTGLDPNRRYEFKATVVDATPGARLEFALLGSEWHSIIGGGAIDRTPTDVTTVFQPPTPDVDLQVCMTSYGGNPPGHLTVRAVALSAREDWSRTRAYLLDVGTAKEGRGIRLNVRGREPRGLVDPGEEYAALRARIASGLLALRDERSRPLVSRVYAREELYRGPYAEEGPDLVLDFADGVAGAPLDPNLSEISPDDPICTRVTEGNSGSHRPDGIFLAHGTGIKAGAVLSANIGDVCPTVLHLLGVPIPPDADGRVLFEMLEPGLAMPPRPAAMPLDTAGRPSSDRVEVYTDDERRQVEDRLRRLGYIE